jgi:hypothetical protein
MDATALDNDMTSWLDRGTASDLQAALPICNHTAASSVDSLAELRGTKQCKWECRIA